MPESVATVMKTARMLATAAWATVRTPTCQRVPPTSTTSGDSTNKIGRKWCTNTVGDAARAAEE